MFHNSGGGRGFENRHNHRSRTGRIGWMGARGDWLVAVGYVLLKVAEAKEVVHEEAEEGAGQRVEGIDGIFRTIFWRLGWM